MPSIFDPEVSQDLYLDHMRHTMEWIQEKIEDHRREPSHKGYHIEIVVEAQWLQQLVAECVAKHQMLIRCQEQLGLARWPQQIDYRMTVPGLEASEAEFIKKLVTEAIGSDQVDFTRPAGTAVQVLCQQYKKLKPPSPGSMESTKL